MSRRGAVKKLKEAVDWMQVPTFKSALSPATGTGKFWPKSAKSIRFVKKGCANRPFYQVVVMEVSFNSSICLIYSSSSSF